MCKTTEQIVDDSISVMCSCLRYYANLELDVNIIDNIRQLLLEAAPMQSLDHMHYEEAYNSMITTKH